MADQHRDIPAPLRPDQLPSCLRNADPTEGDENGPFLVINKTGDVLDRRDYCGWRAPEHGNGYEYDCEPRAYSEAAKAQWATGVPDWFNAIGRKRSARYDCMIAATAIQNDARLATNNVADYRAFAPLGLRLL